MPMNRKLLGAAAFSLALAGGGAAGAILGTPNLTLAQDSDTDETTETTPPTRPPPAATAASSCRPPPKRSGSPRTSCAPPSRTASRSPRSPRTREWTCRR